MDTAHLWQAMAYVDRNPVRAHLVPQAEDYDWSSARARMSAAQSETVHLDLWQAEYDWPRWKKVLATSIDEEAFGHRLQEASRRSMNSRQP